MFDDNGKQIQWKVRFDKAAVQWRELDHRWKAINQYYTVNTATGMQLDNNTQGHNFTNYWNFNANQIDYAPLVNYAPPPPIPCKKKKEKRAVDDDDDKEIGEFEEDLFEENAKEQEPDEDDQPCQCPACLKYQQDAAQAVQVPEEPLDDFFQNGIRYGKDILKLARAVKAHTDECPHCVSYNAGGRLTICGRTIHSVLLHDGSVDCWMPHAITAGDDMQTDVDMVKDGIAYIKPTPGIRVAAYECGGAYAYVKPTRLYIAAMLYSAFGAYDPELAYDRVNVIEQCTRLGSHTKAATRLAYYATIQGLRRARLREKRDIKTRNKLNGYAGATYSAFLRASVEQLGFHEPVEIEQVEYDSGRVENGQILKGQLPDARQLVTNPIKQGVLKEGENYTSHNRAVELIQRRCAARASLIVDSFGRCMLNGGFSERRHDRDSNFTRQLADRNREVTGSGGIDKDPLLQKLVQRAVKYRYGKIPELHRADPKTDEGGFAERVAGKASGIYGHVDPERSGNFGYEVFVNAERSEDYEEQRQQHRQNTTI